MDSPLGRAVQGGSLPAASCPGQLGCRDRALWQHQRAGLVAKPILDILVGGLEAKDPSPYIQALTPLGYDYAEHAGVPDHFVFGRGTARTHLVHVVRYGGDAWHRGLAFRDALRRDAGLRDAYGALKHELAGRHGAERSRYTTEKGVFIERVLGLRRL